jgi:hypothetical protein
MLLRRLGAGLAGAAVLLATGCSCFHKCCHPACPPPACSSAPPCCAPAAPAPCCPGAAPVAPAPVSSYSVAPGPVVGGCGR